MDHKQIILFIVIALTVTNKKLMNMKKVMSFSVLMIFIFFLISGCGNNQKPVVQENVIQEKPQPTAAEIVQRGEYLVNLGGCNDCHSPKKMDPTGPVVIAERMLSGHPSDEPLMKFNPSLLKGGLVIFNSGLTSTAGMWGVSFSANLTPDQTGIGNWTEENFIRALKQGKYKGLEGSRTLLPPMPWQNFKNVTEDDIKAMFAYLKSIKAVSNVVPMPVPLENLK